MYIVNSGNVLNFCILEVVCLLGDHKTDRFVDYIQMYKMRDLLCSQIEKLNIFF